MKYPELSAKSRTQKQILTFKGYNHNDSISDGEFYEMENLSSRLYPLLTSRLPRGTARTIVKPNGLTDKNGLVYVDGTNFYYNGVLCGTVTDTPKHFASMGAYIIILPDKKCYDTVNNTMTNLEATYTTTGSVSVVGCTLDGTPTDAATSLYAKITVAGIGANFKKYDGITISGSTSVINGSKIIQAISTDYIVVSARIGTIAFHTGITVSRAMPNMDYIIESDNRLWGCSSTKHEIYSSKLGDPTNWNCYEGISTDSYTATVGTDGEFTGAISYSGYVLFFKEDCVHKIYGSKPSNFQIVTNTLNGVAKGSEKSLCIVNGILYYLSREGVMAYRGAYSENISYNFGEKKYHDAVSGGIADKYYISFRDDESIWHLFAFDSHTGLWHREDNTRAVYFTEYDGQLYYITNNTLKTISGSDNDEIIWSAEFSDFAEKTMNQKYVSKLQLKLEMNSEDSYFGVDIMYDNSGIWEKVKTISGIINKNYTIPILLRRCEFYKIRLSGIGQFKLYGINKIYTEGSGYNGSNS